METLKIHFFSFFVILNSPIQVILSTPYRNMSFNKLCQSYLKLLLYDLIVQVHVSSPCWDLVTLGFQMPWLSMFVTTIFCAI